jgi:hypothetical protein
MAESERGMQRRSRIAPSEYFDPSAVRDTTGGFGRRVHSAALNVASYPAALSTGIHALTGNEAVRDAAAADFLAQQQRAAQVGPEVQTLDDAARVGGVQGYAEWAATQAVNAIPDVALSLATGGVGGAVVGGAARGMARRSVVKAVAQNVAKKEATPELAEAVVKAQGQDAAERLARAQLREATSARTLRDPAVAAAVEASVAPAARAGQVAGAIAGQYPGMVSGSVEELGEATPGQAAAVLGYDAAAAAIGAIPITRALDRLGAGDAVKATARDLLPRVAKEFAKQGAAEGGAEVAQTAVQLAGHRWVNENLDLLGPDALNQYLASFVGGAVVGGALGGGIELGKVGGQATGDAARRGAKAVVEGAKSVGAAVRPMYDSLRESLSKAAQSARARTEKKYQPGEPMGEPKADAASTNAAGIYDKVQAGIGKVAEAFERNRKRFMDEDDIDARASDLSARFESGDDAAAPISRRPVNNPFDLGTKLQNTIAANVPVDHPLWGAEDELRGMVAAGERLLLGKELTARDERRLDLLREVAPDFVDLARSAYAQGGFRSLAKLNETISADDDVAPTGADAPRTALVDDRLDDTYTGVGGVIEDAPVGPEALPAPDRELSTTDQMLSLRRQIEGLTPDAPNRAALIEQGVALKQKLRDELTGGKSALWTENRSTAAAKQQFADRQPGGKYGATFAPLAEQVDTSGGKRTQLIDLGTLIMRQRAKVQTEGTKNEDIPAQQALLRGIAELKLAGVEINFKAMRPGLIEYVSETTGERRPLMRLTRREIKALQSGKGGKIVRGDAERDQRTGFSEAPAKAMDEDPIDSGKDNERFELKPRATPPGRRDAETELFIPDAVADVDASSPYAKQLNKAREVAKSKLPAPKKRAAIAELGREIARAEIAKRNPDNERRRNIELRQVEGSTARAIEWLNRAARGKLDTAKVREAPTDKERAKGRDESVRPNLKRMAQLEARVAEGDAAGKDTSRDKAEMQQRVSVETTARGVDPNAPKQVEAKPRQDPKAERPKEAEVVRSERGKAKDAAEAARLAAKSDGKAKLTPVEDRFRDEDVDEVGEGKGEHDYAKETSMLNALLDAMGIKQHVTVVAENDQRGGSYEPGTGIVRIHPSLKGAERLEVLAHELGHHVKQHAWAEASPETRAAIEKDFEQWKSEQGSRKRRVNVRATRAPKHRAEALKARAKANPKSAANQMLKDLSESDVLLIDEYIADHIARVLTSNQKSLSIVDKFFKSLADQLTKLYAKLFKGGKSKWAPNKNVEAWIESLFKGPAASVSAALGQTVSTNQANIGTRAAMQRFSNGNIKDLIEFLKYRLPPEARRILAQATSRYAVMKMLRDEYKGNETVLNALEDDATGMEARIAAAYLLWQDGKLKLGPDSTKEMNTLWRDFKSILDIASNDDYAHRIFTDIAYGRVDRFLQAGKKYDIREIEARSRGRLNRAANWFDDVSSKVTEPWGRFINGMQDVMRDMGVPAINRIASLLHREPGKTGDKASFHNAVTHTTARFNMRAAKAMAGLSPREQHRVVRHLQLQRGATGIKGGPKVEAAAKAVRQLLDDAYEYMKAKGVDVGPKADYFPVVLDLRNEQMKAKLRAIIAKPRYKDAIIKFFEGNERKTYNTPEEAQAAYEGYVENLMRGATRDEPGAPTTEAGAPNFKGANFRSMGFIYDYAKRHADDNDAKAFAALQAKDPTDIFSRYIDPMVRRAEYADRFGDKGTKLNALLEEAKKQGATDAQIEYAKNAVEAALGTYGADGSPVLKAISPKLAERVAGRKTQHVLQGLQAYQNLRLLPLALLSSLVDPMGIAVRTGGDFKTAWQGVKLGFKALTDKATRAEIEGMIELMGTAADMASDAGLHSGFGGGQTPGSKRVNEAVFKGNGMSWWVRGTRYMALEAAHKFLLKHAEGAAKGDETSLRYLRELDVKPADIATLYHANANGDTVPRARLMTETERAAATEEARKADDRVRAALIQFIDEAILRPNPQQSPRWHADPYMGLVTQYKSFAYAIYDQIGGRLGHEMRQGNSRVFLAALAYLPIVMIAELLRETIQFGPGGDERREEWGPEHYAALAIERTGLLGPARQFYVDTLEDVEAKRLPGSSYIGPTLSQGRNTFDAFEGQRDLGKTFEESLPLSTLWKRWNDNLGAQT